MAPEKMKHLPVIHVLYYQDNICEEVRNKKCA